MSGHDYRDFNRDGKVDAVEKTHARITHEQSFGEQKPYSSNIGCGTLIWVGIIAFMVLLEIADIIF